MQASTTLLVALVILRAAFATAPLHAAIPDAIPFQGRVAVDGTNFTGTGQFKFAVYEHPADNFTPASATAKLTGSFVTSVSLASGGSGYTTSVTVSFSGGGSGAAATATLSRGVITSITVTAAGTGYTSAPTVVLTDPRGAVQLWNNTGTSGAALEEPATSVSLPVTNGLYTVGLGDSGFANMAGLPASLIPSRPKRLFLHVWFNDGTHGFQPLLPDVELHSVPFAREAITAQNATYLGGVPLTTLARTDTANTFTHVNGLTVQGSGPAGNPTGVALPVTGTGTRLEFIPGLSAFRAGTVTGDHWDAANVGKYSTALGIDTIASGLYSVAAGSSTTASAYNATALGSSTVASAPYATAFGYSTTASGTNSTAFGAGTTASGDRTTVFGVGSTASGAYAVAGGYFATAAGTGSLSLGAYTTAASAYEAVFGRFNTDYTPASATAWNGADRLFVVGNGTSSSARSDALSVYKNGVFTLGGTGPNLANRTPAPDATVPITGAGTRLLFLPGYGALRAGTVTGDQWDPANIGLFSVALGFNNRAGGGASTALGNGVNATGDGATALGAASTASGDYSAVLGTTSIASGAKSIALGTDNTASADSATALGFGNTASAVGALACGFQTTASGPGSAAFGVGTLANGANSTASGYGSTASGSFSTAYGTYATASSAYETAIGRYNTTPSPASTSGWVATDRLFVIGNGTSDTARSNAFVVLKNGNATLKGTLTQSSDRNRKTDIVPADTASILDGVAALPLATWKYKDESVTHLGPMAQDFFAAFQLGGDETGIASVDADGVALAAIQELKRQLDAKDARIAALEREQAELKYAQATTAARLAALEAKLK